ncbi:MAG: insulinase family protein [Acidobacteria bacterium]|nr:insulinase family protein [Acidobacteriota bacterium]
MSRIARACVMRGVLPIALAVWGSPAFAQTRNWPSESPPRPLAARDVKFPPYEIRTLANGLQVIAVEHHEQPAVSMRMLVRVGSAQEPPGRSGLASMLASLLDQGTVKRSAQQIADTIDFIGGELSTGAGSDLTFVHVLVMKDSFDLGLGLLSEIARAPAFAQEELERQRQQVRSALKVSYEDPDYVANVVFDRLVYGFHPYGLPNSGTPESVEKITRDDLAGFHRAYFAPNNAILAIVGDIAPKDAFTAAEKIFGDWPRKEITPVSISEPPPPTRRVVIVDKPDAVQTEVRIGHLGLPRKHPDYMALNLTMKILGGEGANRLHRVLRSERGLTYGASADFETFKLSGNFKAETDTRSEATPEVLRLMVEEFGKMQREPAFESELADAKAYLSGSFPLTIETPDAIATQVLNAIFYELPLKDLETFRDRVNAVRVDDISRVARAFLKPDRLSVVLVGNASAFASKLAGVGFGKFETVSLRDLDLTTTDFKRGKANGGGTDSDVRYELTWAAQARSRAQKRPSAAPPTAEDLSRGKALVERAAKAKGGLEKLKGVRTLTATATTRLMTPQGPVEAETRTLIAYPDRFRIEAKLPQGEIVETFAGGEAWIKDPTGVHDAPPPMRDEFHASAQRDLILLLIEAAAGKLQARARPATGADERDLEALELSRGESDRGPVTLFLDKATGLIVKVTYVADTPVGPQRTEELLSDYRMVDGVQVAYKAIMRRGDQTILERAVSELKLNVALDDTLFKKP